MNFNGNAENVFTELSLMNYIKNNTFCQNDPGQVVNFELIVRSPTVRRWSHFIAGWCPFF